MNMNNIHYKYTAIIIEPREHRALDFVLNNFLENLSTEWSIIIFHGNKNKDFILNIVSNLNNEYKKRIINLIDLEVDNLNSETYSDILKSINFYNHIPTELFLIFQTDSIILKENKDNINFF